MTLPSKKSCLLFYVKFPEYGQVKTRLAKEIGNEHAIALYKCFVLDMLDVLTTIPQQICLCYTPQHAEQYVRDWLGENYLYIAQHGNSLGERMHNSFQQAFQQGFEYVVLAGSDLPDLPSHYLLEAFEQLQHYESIIGPSSDGGYYLLGFRHNTFFPEVFQQMQWSHSFVYIETLKKLKKRGLNFLVLPEWDDIDNFRELQQWYRRNQSENTLAARTITYLNNMRGIHILLK